MESIVRGNDLHRFKPSAPVTTGEIGGIFIAMVFVVILLMIVDLAGAIGSVEALFALTIFVVWYAWLFSACLRALKGNHIKNKAYEGKGHSFPRMSLYLI